MFINFSQFEGDLFLDFFELFLLYVGLGKHIDFISFCCEIPTRTSEQSQPQPIEQ